MSYLKINEEIFLEKAELSRFEQGLRDNGFVFDKKTDTAMWGIIRNKFYDPNFDFLKIVDTANSNKFRIQNGFAFDIDRLVIKWNNGDKDITIPTSSQKYWIKISHEYSNIEEGYVSVGGANKSLINGVGTKFTEILRGQPNFPSRIKFTNSQYYTLEYEILEVIDDNNVLVQGIFDTLEADLQFIVVGSFTPGVQVLPLHKNIFMYDSCKMEMILDNGFTPPTIFGKEFILGSVYYDTNGILIEDYRWNFVHEDFTHRKVDDISAIDKLVGIESVKKIGVPNTDSYVYIVNFDFKFNITGEVQNNFNSTIHINNGYGGVWTGTSEFVDGDFDNWRYYYQDGNYSTILKSYINQGTIVLIVDSVRLGSGVGTCITPNCEDIKILMKMVNDTETSTLFTRTEYFPINCTTPTIMINKDEVVFENQIFQLYFVLKNHFKYNNETRFYENEYYNELAYSLSGVLTDPTKTTTSSNVILQNTISSSQKYFPLRCPISWYPETTAQISTYFDATGLGVTNNIFTGWAICNGQNTTPDMRGRMIIGTVNNIQGTSPLGVDVDPLTPGVTNFSFGDIGGKQKVALAISEMPSHDHGGATGNDGGHTHNLTDPGHTHNMLGQNGIGGLARVRTGNGNTSPSVTTDSATTGISIDSVADHAHSINGQGGGDKHENLPTYISLVWIMRIN
jgi:microcystin-dependent protein